MLLLNPISSNYFLIISTLFIATDPDAFEAVFALANFVPPRRGTREQSQAFDPTWTRDRRDRSSEALSLLFFFILAHVYLPTLISWISNTYTVSGGEWDYQAEAIRGSIPSHLTIWVQHSLQTQKP